MLACAPYKVPLGEDEWRNREAKSGLHARGTLCILTGGISTHVSEDEQGEEPSIPSPHGKKRIAPEDLEAEVSKRGKKPSPGGPAPEGNIAAQHPQGGQPLTKP